MTPSVTNQLSLNLQELYVQFSPVLSPVGPSVGHKGRFSRDALPVSSAGGLCEQFQHGQDVHSLTSSIQLLLRRPRRRVPSRHPEGIVCIILNLFLHYFLKGGFKGRNQSCCIYKHARKGSFQLSGIRQVTFRQCMIRSLAIKKETLTSS